MNDAPMTRERQPSTRETVCERCAGSGEIARSIYYPCGYRGPGPVPEYASGVYATPCEECEGTGALANQEAA